MTQRHTAISKICNKYLILIFIALISTQSAFGAQISGGVEYKNVHIDYTKIDKSARLQSADYYFNKAMSTEDEKEKADYLQKASGDYFILTRTDNKDIYSIVQLARTYDYERKNRYAKSYFSQALMIDPKNPFSNYYFGEYYFRRSDYRKARKYFNNAFSNGLDENYDNMYKMGVIYEKLGDILTADTFYKKAFMLDQNRDEASDRLMQIDTSIYKDNNYYQDNKQEKK